MLKRNCLALTLLVSFLIPASILQVQAQGGTIVLNPTDDAYTDGSNYNSNYGSEPELKTLGFGDYLTWLKFDLSSIPEGAIGVTAILELYTIYNGVTEPHGVVACLILNNFNNSWTEDTITANNHPPYPDDVELDTEFVANDETWYEWIVTEAIVSATANDATAVTILMRYPWGLQTPAISFTSKEGSLTKMPRLTVTWTDVIPPDKTPPTVSIMSPQNKTYTTDYIPLTFTVDEETSWIGYSLDYAVNVTIAGNTTLTNLLDGGHCVVVFANDTAGNMGSSDTVYFTVDTVSPNIEVLSPENKTYATSSVPLSFTVDEATSWMGYSLDGQANIMIAGNTTLTELSDGMHSLIVYASDIAGNVGSPDTVYFTIQTTPIDTTPPSISIVSPESKTYDTTDIQLTFTVDESVSWMAYSLDYNANVTITGNTTLSGLSDGSHSLVVYVRDTAGNTGASDRVYFSVETPQPEPFQVEIAVIGIIAAVGAVVLVYFLKFRK